MVNNMQCYKAEMATLFEPQGPAQSNMSEQRLRCVVNHQWREPLLLNGKPRRLGQHKSRLFERIRII